MVFKLGDGNKIVGVSSYCKYPPEVNKITKVGSFMTINYELILSLKPDLIIDYKENVKTQRFAKKNNIKILSLKHKSLKDIYDSIILIGKILNKTDKSYEIVSHIKKRIGFIKKKVRKRKKILVIISRQPGTFKNMYILGTNDYLNTIIKLSGGDNVYKGKISYPQVSEEIFYTNPPDIIVELYPDKKIKTKILLKDWERFKNKKFYKNIKIIKDNYPVIPGPRIYKTAELFYKIINKSK
jgi:iron complex transport system substrate-binding protein